MTSTLIKRTLALAFVTSIFGCKLAIANDLTFGIWPTQSIATTGDFASSCQTPNRVIPKYTSVAPAVTERDIAAWDESNGKFTLKETNWKTQELKELLLDRCFVLVVNGRILTQGVILSSHSARLSTIPTLSVFSENDKLILQFNAGNRSTSASGEATPIYLQELKEVFSASPVLSTQLAALAIKEKISALPDYHGAGARWISAVHRLMLNKRIFEGMSREELVSLIGEPSSIQENVNDHAESTQSYSWYFNTPIHVNPLFSALVKMVRYKVLE